ncbi:maleylpyruvate isomerase family mycothiol-dependent enzyme [Nocardioides marmotae]|uniref:maleylpyruvate isomerase family mycothiol-dependent enzyme n=1 Tax=Nocardioides marmotae TaxID=2663857 RepID=UPI0012B51C48|nr:maleylpyruvate isomerase family mycothiol-dependent enzyme [Nocardioides marmotae]MBC9734104.1 maleylpyruvate isomerase family mycothiol-dependent enzyme [Nocardioides marmotae]MTB85207.1 maleylpyruvate isomerase family mycothiol-dependent enzyme [Nocardioides marmotae]
MADPGGLWDTIAVERTAFADLLADLTPQQWAMRSLCPAWTVHDVVAHLVSAQDAGARAKLAAAVRGRGVPSRVTEVLAEQYAARSPAELVSWLRDHPDSRFAPPGMGPRATLVDVLVHRLDVAVPLGIAVDRPPEPWGPALDFLLSRTPMLGVLRRGFPRAAYRATDLDWSHGTGAEVHGPAAALGSVLAGRAALVDRLDGPGAAAVRAWAGA